MSRSERMAAGHRIPDPFTCRDRAHALRSEYMALLARLVLAPAAATLRAIRLWALAVRLHHSHDRTQSDAVIGIKTCVLVAVCSQELTHDSRHVA